MRVLVCGSRDFIWIAPIASLMRTLPAGSVIIEGGAKGADTIARELARQLGFHVLEFPANWKHLGKAAGPVRNERMLKEGNPEAVLAFYTDMSTSKGTKNMVMQATKAGIKVLAYDHATDRYY